MRLMLNFCISWTRLIPGFPCFRTYAFIIFKSMDYHKLQMRIRAHQHNFQIAGFLLLMRRQQTIAPYGTLILQELIGKGSYGQIYKAYADAQNKQYAIKIISSDTHSDSLANIQRQIKILMSCNHPNIVKCHSVQIIDQMVWIVMDYYSRGSLADIMAREKRTFSQPQIRLIMSQITDALAYLHARNVIHRDIKAANILVDDQGDIKVADFGVSTLISQSHRHTRTGSPLWMSPELLSNSTYSFKTDIWSLGITALQLAEGVPPYSHQHPYRAIFSIQSHPPCSLSEPKKWSPEFNSFVEKCLTLDEKKRPSARELQHHQFVNGSFSDHKMKCGAEGLAQCNESVIKYENSGTVILHSEFDGSLWEKNNATYLNENVNNQNSSCGTFKINPEKEKAMPISLLAQITKGMPLEQTQNKVPEHMETVESLYLRMEEEIKSVRKKYLAKIKALEQKQLLTFGEQLKKTKGIRN